MTLKELDEEFEQFWSDQKLCDALNHRLPVEYKVKPKKKILHTLIHQLPDKYKLIRKRCGECTSCKTEDCGACINCEDKPKFGGNGVRKRGCLERVCKESIQLGKSERQKKYSPRRLSKP
tara:strand:+ start:1344 stop:1703 length:360 start_codon:yes stop_codon:yes gene_type:complete